MEGEFSPEDVGGTLDWILENIVHFSGDFVAFIAITALVAAFSFYFGRNRIVPLIAALYTAIPLFLFFPYDTSAYGGAIISVALYLFFVFVAFIAFLNLAAFVSEGSFGLIQITILSILAAGMIIAISIHILPVEEMYTFSEPTKALFDSAESFFFWLVAPLVGIFFFGRG